MPRHRFAHRLLPILMLAFALGVGCARFRKAPPIAEDDAVLVPKEVEVVIRVDLARFRSTELGQKLLDLRQKMTKRPDAGSPDGPPMGYDEFVAKCGLDPLRQIDSVFLALPAADDSSEFAALIRGSFDETKLVGCADSQAKKDGGELRTTLYEGRRLYSGSKNERFYVTFLSDKIVALGGPAWVRKVVDRTLGRGAKRETLKENQPLQALIRRVRTSDAGWAAGLVPESVRERLKASPGMEAASTIQGAFGSVDFQSGLALTATVDLVSNEAAESLRKRVSDELGQAKKTPQLLVTGMSQYLDAVQVIADGVAFKVTLRLTPRQVDDLLGRIEGFFKSLGSAVGRTRIGP